MRLVLALLTCVLLVGCGGSSVQDKMIGSWQVDVDYLSNMEEFKKASAQEQGMYKMMAGAMTLTVTEDEIQFEASIMGQTKKESKPYTIKEDKGDVLVVETKDDKGKAEVVHVTFDGDIMIITQPGDEEPPLPFKRKE